MDDVLSHGMDREPRRWPGRLALVAVIVGLAVALVLHIPHSGQHSPTRQGSPPAAGPVQLAGLGSRAADLLNHHGAGASALAIIHYPGPSPPRWWESPRNRRLLASCGAVPRPRDSARNRFCALVSARQRR